MVWVWVVLTACGRFGFEDAALDCAHAPADTRCFEMMQGSATWADAVAACQQQGPTTHLATIASADDNAIAARLAATIPFGASETNTNQRQRMWLGGTDVATVGTWLWTDGSPFAYSNWRPGQPGSPGVEDCVILLGSEGGVWDDRPCSYTYEAWLCERD